MAALTAIGLGLGVASMGYGLYQQQQGKQQAKEGYALQQQGALQQAQAAALQAQISKEQAAASVDFAGRERNLNIVAADQSVEFSSRARDINRGIVGNERAIEARRMQAMQLDGRRRGLEVIRNQQRARAVALTNANAQGARTGSGLQGGYGQIAGQSGVNAMGIQQNLMLGQDIFNFNNAITGQREQYSDLQFNYAVQQANNQTIKSNIMYDYAATNAAFQTRQADAGTMMSQGQGTVNKGAGLVGAGGMTASMGNTFMSMGPTLFGMGVTGSNVFASAGGGGPTMLPSFSGWGGVGGVSTGSMGLYGPKGGLW